MAMLRNGALGGAVFGLAAAAANALPALLQAIMVRIGMPPEALAQAAAIDLALLTVAGTLLAPLLRLPHGRSWHLLALALLWGAAQFGLALNSPLLRIPSLAAAPLALVLTGAGVWIAHRRVGLAVCLGVGLLALAITGPSSYLALTTPAAEPHTKFAAAPAGSPDVVLIVLDTVRAANVSAYGYARPTTPVFDALAAEGALFLDATSPSTWSLASHGSLFTGLFPSVHGAHFEHAFLETQSPTLAETLAEAGYETRCFTANAFISPSLGLTRGFQWTDEAWRSGGAGSTFLFAFRLLDWLGFGSDDKGGRAVVESFERWAADSPAGSRPTFAFLNFLEAHFPYHQLPDDYLGLFTEHSRSELQALSMELMGVQFGGEPPADAALAARLATDMYDGGIAYTDYLLGRVVEALRSRGTLDQTLLIVLADHGEMLGEHNVWGHGAALYEPGIRVPLLVRYPTRIPIARVATPVSTVGVYATILDLLGLTSQTKLHVESLLPAVSGGPPGGPVFSERHSNPAAPRSDVAPAADMSVRIRSYRAGQLKLITTSAGDAMLFDLETDPNEQTDLAASRPADLARLQDELLLWRGALGLPAIDRSIDSGEVPELDPQMHERLRTLGYVE
jgi:arylsulfatase A-like enzyme